MEYEEKELNTELTPVGDLSVFFEEEDKPEISSTLGNEHGDFDFDDLLELKDAVAPDSSDQDSSSLIQALENTEDQKAYAHIPKGPYAVIPKSEMLRGINIGDMVLGNDLYTSLSPSSSKKQSKMKASYSINLLEKDKPIPPTTVYNFFALKFANDVVFIKLSNRINYITIKAPASSSNMTTDYLCFFKNDLKAYVFSCEDDGFVISKQESRRLTYLFRIYVTMKSVILSEEKGAEIFDDNNPYDHSCYVDANTIRPVAYSISQVAEKKSKNEKLPRANRVQFYGNTAITVLPGNSFLIHSFPDDTRIPNCKVGTSFINILSALVPVDSREKIEIRLSSAQRIKVVSDSFEMSSPLYNNEGSDYLNEIQKILRSVHEYNFTMIDMGLLRRIASYSCSMRLSKEKLVFHFEEGGRVLCFILHEEDSRRYRYPPICLNTVSETHNPEKLKLEIAIEAQPLHRLLKAFERSDYLGMFLCNTYIMLKGELGASVTYAVIPCTRFDKD